MNDLYIYCLADAGEYIKIDQRGFAGQEIFCIIYRDICALVSETTVNRLDVTDNNVFLHEQISEMVMKERTVLPMRFNSILPDEKSVLTLLQTQYDVLKDNITNLHNKWEFGLKAIWDVEKIEKQVMETLQYRDFDNKLGFKNSSPANEYLKKAMKKQFLDKELRQVAQGYIEQFNREFQYICVDLKYKTLCTRKMFCSISYLIPREKADLVQQIQEEIEVKYPEVKFLFSGPWPPYNFVNMGGG